VKKKNANNNNSNNNSNSSFLLDDSEEEQEKEFRFPGLLAERWLGNASSVSRKGKISNNEELIFHHTSSSLINSNSSSSGSSSSNNGKSKSKSVSSASAIALAKKNAAAASIIRFKSKKDGCDGTLPRNLSAFLAPLLAAKLISLEAKSMMMITDLRIGIDIPLALRVYITNERFFTTLFKNGAEEGGAVKKVKGWGTSGSSGQESVLTSAAFALLNWAQFGLVSENFTPPPQPKEEEELPAKSKSKKAAKKKQKKSKNNGSEEDGNNSTMDDSSSDNDEEEEEEDFKVGEADGVSSQPEWVKDMTTAASTSASISNLPLCNVTLDGFKKSGVVLHEYQRQALWWMSNRERDPNQNNENGGGDDDNSSEGGGEMRNVESDLDLLLELANSLKASKNGNSSLPADHYSQAMPSDTITCDVSSVKVSKDLYKPGHIHPLWERRFLANEIKDEGRSKLKFPYEFYINDLTRELTLDKPPPPVKCRGGILADQMGLGKTVMVLALILKDLEEEEKAGEDDESKVRIGQI
jgi:hypothetical protein